MKQSMRPRRGEEREPRHRQSARDAGFAAAVGLEVDVVRDEPGDTGWICSHCGTRGKLDMVDATIQRAFLTCPACTRTWDTGRLDQAPLH